MPPVTISELKKTCREHSPQDALLHAQIERLTPKEASNGKPFQELVLRDASDSITLRAWADTAAFNFCESLKTGDFVVVEGTFSHSPAFGMDARRWEVSLLDDESIRSLMEGSDERCDFLNESYQVILHALDEIRDPRLAALCAQFLKQHGARFRRAAAARGNHHARRGGLLEHTSRMMSCALSLCAVYPEINRDLMIAGVLFHDSGKLWETCPPEFGFGIESELRGELMGHLSIGIELVNMLWRDLPRKDWEGLRPASEDVRLHLIHLIASHHGQLEFGSPVLPKTPEAALLHFIDNIDARMEMFFAAYRTMGTALEWVRPLGVVPVAQLGKTNPSEPENAVISSCQEAGPKAKVYTG